MATQALADLSRLHVVVPVRSVGGGKLRLGEALDPEERESLILGMLRQELTVLREWPACESVHVVSKDAHLLRCAEADGAIPHLQADEGLNDGLRFGRDAAVARGATAVLILPADLPFVCVSSLDRLRDGADAALAAGSARPIVVLVPADARSGTNALLLSPPDAIEPGFGANSFERHLRAAATAGASVQVVPDPALAFDLDTPDDLARIDPDVLDRLLHLGSLPVGP